MLGPALPPGFRRAAYENDDDDDDGEDGEDFPGPALPPGYRAESSSSEGEDEDVIGPMPSKGPIQGSVALDFERRARRMKEKLTGDVSPPFSPSSFICIVCTVQTVGFNAYLSTGKMLFLFKVLLLCCLNSFLCVFLCKQDTPEVLTRETWMTELPPELQHIGLGARTFKKRSGPENKDRSIWTDTPADRERKTRVVNEK